MNLAQILQKVSNYINKEDIILRNIMEEAINGETKYYTWLTLKEVE